MEQDTPTTGRAVLHDLEAARHAAAFSELTGYGWLRLTGRDRLDLLNRLSTNDLRKLAAGEGLPSVLTSPVGRVMALMLVYAAAETVYVRLMPEQAQRITRYLSSMIFFQDEVEVADLTGTFAQFALYGPQSGDLLGRLTGLARDPVPEYSWRDGKLAGADVSIHRGGPLEAWHWTVVTELSQQRAVQAALGGGAVKLNPDTAELLRVQAGIPAWGRELSDQVTPLETGLLPAVSFRKGCYTGQEVIARQTNYDKVTRNLVGLVFDAAPPGALVGGETWQVHGPGRGGFVGSAAYAPDLDRTIALAVVPRELAQPGTVVEVTHGEQTYRATVNGLPFVREDVDHEGAK